MNRLIAASLIVLALVTLVIVASQLGSKSGYSILDAVVVQEGVTLNNNHVEEKVKILRVEDVGTIKVVVFTILSGPGVGVLKGEQRWELESFRHHYHLDKKWPGRWISLFWR